MEIREYGPADREHCLLLAEAVSPNLRARFEAYLDGEKKFFVAEHEGEILGCGGIEVEAPAAELVWGMVRPDKRRMGLGRFLLMYRLKEISKRSSIEFVSVKPPASEKQFFTGQGFREAPDGVRMTKRLTVCP